jgi:hypothetical protein
MTANQQKIQDNILSVAKGGQLIGGLSAILSPMSGELDAQETARLNASTATIKAPSEGYKPGDARDLSFTLAKTVDGVAETTDDVDVQSGSGDLDVHDFTGTIASDGQEMTVTINDGADALRGHLKFGPFSMPYRLKGFVLTPGSLLANTDHGPKSFSIQ